MAEKILKFTESTTLLLDMAEEYAQKGQHSKAVSFIRRAIKNNPDDDSAKYALSQELCLLGQYKLSADVLFEMLTKDPDDPDYNLALGEIFYALNNWNLAAFYFKNYSRFSDEFVTPEPLEEVISLDAPKKFSIVYPMTKDRAKELRHKGALCMRDGRIEEARNIFKEIEDAFPEDSMVKTDIAFTYLLKNDIKNGKLYAKMAYELDNENISAMSNLAMAYNLDGETESCEEICARLNQANPEEPVEIFKIASTFCEVKKDEMAFHWLEKFIKTDVAQSIEIYYLYAFSAYNSGHYKEAEKIFQYVLLIEEDNHVAKYYLQELKPYLLDNDLPREKRWDYYPQIPLSVWRKRIECLNTRQDFYGIWQDEIFMEYVNWAFDTIDDPELHDKLVEKLANTDKKSCGKYFKKLLLNQNVGLLVKGKILFCLLMQGARGRFFMVRDGYFSYIDVPKNIPHILTEAVYLCIAKLSTLFMMDANYPSIIIKVAKNIQSRILDNGLSSDLDIRHLSAVIARNCNFSWLDDKKIMDVFVVTYKEMTELNDYIFNSDKSNE